MLTLGIRSVLGKEYMSRQMPYGLKGFALLCCLSAIAACAEDGKPLSAADHERGRYLTIVGGCNDCHTPGFADKEGQVPEADWLTGDILGWRGPWGTTYAVNLRLYMTTLSEDEWIKTARTIKPRPPMPWWALREMSDDDLRVIYRFVTALGPKGTAVPAYLPPDQEPAPPFVEFPAPPPAK